jgi:hypothetical protein
MSPKDEKSVKERRPLIDGLKPISVNRQTEEAFVFARPPKSDTPPQPLPPAAVEKQEPRTPTMNVIGRMAFTTRIRTDFATALKRASLERQLSGITPNTLQDILEEALEPWLRANGYITSPHQ